MSARGHVVADLPADGDELMFRLLARGSYDDRTRWTRHWPCGCRVPATLSSSNGCLRQRGNAWRSGGRAGLARIRAAEYQQAYRQEDCASTNGPEGRAR